MCDCKKQTESRLHSAISYDLPEGHEELSVNLQGYALMIGDNIMKSRQVMPISITYRAPTKAGVMKDKKQSMSMMANYCMFCGEKYEDAQ